MFLSFFLLSWLKECSTMLDVIQKLNEKILKNVSKKLISL